MLKTDTVFSSLRDESTSQRNLQMIQGRRYEDSEKQIKLNKSNSYSDLFIYLTAKVRSQLSPSGRESARPDCSSVVVGPAASSFARLAFAARAVLFISILCVCFLLKLQVALAQDESGGAAGSSSGSGSSGGGSSSGAGSSGSGSSSSSSAAGSSGATQTGTKNSAQLKNKKTTIDFEDQLVEGSRQKPELFYLLEKKDFNYKRLIRLRDDFLPEMRKGAEDIQGRTGGQ